MRASPIDNKTSFSGSGPKYIKSKHFDWMKDFNGTHQRLILGGTALVTQPVIDYYNPMADEETRKFSVLKTVIKIVVGTAVGASVRHVGMKYAKSLTSTADKRAKIVEKIKDPKTSEKLKEIFADEDSTKNFNSNMGTILGLMGVIVADFTFDLPLAKTAIDKGVKMFGMSPPEKKEGTK